VSRQERYPNLSSPDRLKRLAQQVVLDPGQSDTMRQVARDIAVSAQAELDRRNNRGDEHG
jgi:hypothetical protein